MNIDAHAYNITVRRDRFDGETLFEARVKELPDLVEYGESFEEAYELAVDAIETTAAVFAERGRPMPPPVAPADEYSGRVTLRIPRSLHRALAEAADAEAVSLNQHLVNVLTYYSGYAAGSQAVAEGDIWRTVMPADPEAQQERPPLRLVHGRNVSEPADVGWG